MLPEFNELDTIFEISAIEKDSFLLRAIRRKMTDSMQQYITFLEGLLNPGTTVSALHESRYLSEHDKKEIADLYTELMRLQRTALYAELSKNDKQDADFISALCKLWPSISKKIAVLLTNVKSGWDNQEQEDIQQTYFG